MLAMLLLGLAAGGFVGFRLGRWLGFYQLGASERRTRVLRAKGRRD